MLKKPHVSDCCYYKNGDFNPTYLIGWGERERDRERYGEREREVVSTTEESKVGESG